MSKVLLVNDIKDLGSSYYTPFADFGDYCSDVNILKDDPESVRLAVFTGGEDVDPALYNQKASRRTFYNGHRDKFELKVFEQLKELEIPMFGICRGAQFLCVMAGGTLCQHLDNHSGCGHHVICTSDYREIHVNSLHHQMQLPPITADIIAWAEPKRSYYYIGGNNKNIYPEKEYEVIYYPNIKALGVQYHPEIMSCNSDGFQYFVDLVESYLEI